MYKVVCCMLLGNVKCDEGEVCADNLCQCLYSERMDLLCALDNSVGSNTGRNAL